MGLNTCRKQWKEQRKQNKIENLKIHSTSLARMFFTLQMQVTMANKPGWMPGVMRQSVQWHENKLGYNKARGILECIQHFRESLASGFPKGIRSYLPITVLSEVPFTHLQSGFFQATSHLAPWFSNDNDAFWEYSDGCNSNLVFGYITPQEQLKGAKFSFQYEKKKRLYMASVSLQLADPKLELTRKVLQLAL